MPYIKEERRKFLDDDIIKLSKEIMTKIISIDSEQKTYTWGLDEGELNYVITKLVVECLKAEEHVNYSTLNKYLGVLDAVKNEFYRRVVAKYEDDKIKDNGDVY